MGHQAKHKNGRADLSRAIWRQARPAKAINIKQQNIQQVKSCLNTSLYFCQTSTTLLTKNQKHTEPALCHADPHNITNAIARCVNLPKLCQTQLCHLPPLSLFSTTSQHSFSCTSLLADCGRPVLDLPDKCYIAQF